jgi:hypothetical protein
MRTSLYSLGVIAMMVSGCMSADPADSIGRLSLALSVEKAAIVEASMEPATNRPLLAWHALTNVTSYEIRIERDGELVISAEVKPGEVLCDSGEHTCTFVADMAPETSIAWVRGRNADSDGEWSDAFRIESAH